MSKKAPPGDAPDKPDKTIDDVAKHLGLTRRTVMNMLADGRLKAYRLGPRVIRFRLSEVDAALERIDAAV